MDQTRTTLAKYAVSLKAAPTLMRCRKMQLWSLKVKYSFFKHTSVGVAIKGQLLKRVFTWSYMM